MGAFLAFIVMILAFFISRTLGKTVSDLIEKNFAWFIKYFAWTEIFGRVFAYNNEPKLHSKQELVHLIETSDFMNMVDKMLVMGAIEFTNRKVSDVMVEGDKIMSVKSNDVVGPKLLDELHQSGHMVFPVMKAKNFIGMLHIEDITSFDQGEKMVTDVMRRVPVNINKNATLEETLVSMKDDHSFQLLVTDDEGELVGLIDICDIVNVLLGRAQHL
jgi:Mg2+/Co2+ transporter CorC